MQHKRDMAEQKLKAGLPSREIPTTDVGITRWANCAIDKNRNTPAAQAAAGALSPHFASPAQRGLFQLCSVHVHV
jgi:hypothetical protein